MARSLYTLHPSFAHHAAIGQNLLAKTGRSLDDWLALIQQSGLQTKPAQANWLRDMHRIGRDTAQYLVQLAAGEGSPEHYNPEALVNAQYAGPKASLRALYDSLLTHALALGTDVTASPTNTAVSISRGSVFAQLKATTRTRIDLGLALGDLPSVSPLIDTGGWAKKDRITHRIPLSEISDLNETVVTWLQRAYQRAPGR